jgi:hypothetical protein
MQRPQDKQIYQSRYYVTIANKHVSTAKNRCATAEVLFEMGFNMVVRAKGLYGRQLGQPSQFCTGGCEEKGQVEKSWKGAAFREDLSAEVEESTLLKAVTRERLLKTQQAGKGLERAVVICE